MKTSYRIIIIAIAVFLGSFTTIIAGQRPKVGLVLGGGGAKGAAEVGVLKYIEQAGVPIDYIVGTSIGSIVGGLYSCGLRADDLDSLFRSQQWLNLLTDRNDDLRRHPFVKKDGNRYMFGFPVGKHKKGTQRRHGVLKGDSICDFLTQLTKRPDSISFDKLPIPFRCVAVEATSFTETVFDSGRLAECMRASMSIPLAFKPVCRDSLVYVDGGMLNNLPVDVCRAMGADIIIAVDLTQNHHANDTAYAIPEKKLKKLLRYPRLVKLVAWARRRPDLVKYQDNLKNIDVYINPTLTGMNAASFTPLKISQMIEAGEQAGIAALPELLELKKKLQK